MKILRGAEPFLLPSGKRGVLLLHGFTGSPSEMRLIGNKLHEAGFTILAPRLPGHGTTPQEMSLTRWTHWYDAAQDGYHILRALCDEISVIGLSMGGLLALHLANEYPVAKLVSLAAPIYISDKRLGMLSMYQIVRRYYHKPYKVYPDIDPIYSVGYDQTPLVCLESLLELIKEVDELLPQIQTPTLVIQSHNDHTVTPKSGKHIFERLGSKEKQILWLEKSGHALTIDCERHRVFEAVEKFLDGL